MHFTNAIVQKLPNANNHAPGVHIWESLWVITSDPVVLKILQTKKYVGRSRLQPALGKKTLRSKRCMVILLRKQYENESKPTHFRDWNDNHAPFTELWNLVLPSLECLNLSFQQNASNQMVRQEWQDWSVASSPALKPCSLQFSSVGWTCAVDGYQQGVQAAATWEPSREAVQGGEGEIWRCSKAQLWVTWHLWNAEKQAHKTTWHVAIRHKMVPSGDISGFPERPKRQSCKAMINAGIFVAVAVTIFY